MKNKCDGGALEQSSGRGSGWQEEWLSNELSVTEAPAVQREEGRNWLRKAVCFAKQCLPPGRGLRRECLNTSCRLQPFCRCARAAWAVSNSRENRLWILLLLLALALIGLSLV